MLELMPAPGVYGEGDINPFLDAELIDHGAQPAVLYATDRAPAQMDDSRYTYYTNKRGHVLRLGVAHVNVGHDESITWDEARRISLLKNRSDNYPLQVASVEEFGPLAQTVRPFDEEIEKSEAPGERFVAEVERRLARSRSQDVYIYVHGYKVDFENSALVSSELWHFLGYQGVFIAYSWPTTAKTLAYFSDLENTTASARKLRQLIVYLSQNTSVERIHVIGYSAGTRLVARTIADLALLAYGLDEQELRQNVRLGHVILTGSDVDRATLGGYLLDGAAELPDSLTLYLSSTDKALGMSRLAFGRSRVGQVDDISEVGPATRDYFENTPALRMIDVSDAEGSTTGNGHAYFRASPWVSSDILTTLLYDLPPEARGLQRSAKLPVWTFPDDYVARIRSALRSVNPELFPD